KLFGGVMDLRKEQMRVFVPGEDRNRDDDEIIKGFANPVYAQRFGDAYAHAAHDIELVQVAAPSFDEAEFLAGRQTPMFFGSARRSPATSSAFRTTGCCSSATR